MTEIKVFRIPESKDVLMKQYGDGTIEIRANMTKFTGTGELIASIELTGDHNVDQKDVKRIEKLFDLFEGQ